MLRHDLARLERLAREHLTRDQRLVLAWQVGLPLLSTREFCRRFGWSQEKYRKVAQRARTRLRALMAADDPVAAGRAEAARGAQAADGATAVKASRS
jgi:DNA-directed RNA polymerase specialized sigma24 family protein